MSESDTTHVLEWSGLVRNCAQQKKNEEEKWKEEISEEKTDPIRSYSLYMV